MFKRNPLLFAAVLALPFTALAQSQDQLIERYTNLAGSKQNATSLVTGLRDGKAVTLTSKTGKETFTPPTGKMGYGNVDNALALAEASLKEKGITRPTPAQLEASTMEILRMRADGKGWGQIADAKGFKLGEVKRADGAERVARAERPNRPERPEKPERPERPERPEKPHKPR
jgi:hypothetical protein